MTSDVIARISAGHPPCLEVPLAARRGAGRLTLFRIRLPGARDGRWPPSHLDRIRSSDADQVEPGVQATGDHRVEALSTEEERYGLAWDSVGSGRCRSSSWDPGFVDTTESRE